jgi:hypothetical protein
LKPRNFIEKGGGARRPALLGQGRETGRWGYCFAQKKRSYCLVECIREGSRSPSANVSRRGWRLVRAHNIPAHLCPKKAAGGSLTQGRSAGLLRRSGPLFPRVTRPFAFAAVFWQGTRTASCGCCGSSAQARLAVTTRPGRYNTQPRAQDVTTPTGRSRAGSPGSG